MMLCGSSKLLLSIIELNISIHCENAEICLIYRTFYSITPEYVNFKSSPFSLFTLFKLGLQHFSQGCISFVDIILNILLALHLESF